MARQDRSVAFLCALLASGCAYLFPGRFYDESPALLPVGAPIPDFALHDARTGHWWSPDRLRGAPAILVFLRDPASRPCRAQMEDLESLKLPLASARAELVIVASGEARRWEDLVDRRGSPFPILLDPDDHAARSFGVYDRRSGSSVPATFFVGPDGRIQWRHAGRTRTDRVGASDIRAWVLEGRLPEY